jgi:hypothetical protein
LLLLMISTMGYGFSTRPHHFTYLMSASFLLILLQHPQSRWKMLLLLPGLGWCWMQLHGAFFIGLVLLLAATLSRALTGLVRKDRQELRAASLAAGSTLGFGGLTFINPYGTRLWSFIAESGSNARPYLSEWAPFSLTRDALTHPDFLVLVAITLLAAVFSRTRRDPTGITLLALGLAAALFMRRNIPLFAITCAFVLPRLLDALAGSSLDRLLKRIPGSLLASLLAAFSLLSVWAGLTFDKRNALEIEVNRDEIAVDAVRFIQRHRLTGNLLVFFDWAEYCIWHLYPDCRVFIDGRLFSAYSERTARAYLDFLYHTGNPNAALTDYATQMVLVHRGNPAYRRMLDRVGWVLVYEDHIAALFLTETGRAAAGLPATPYRPHPAHRTGPVYFPGNR